MFIVHGTENADKLRGKYTVLELDTVPSPDGSDKVTLYTVLDTGKLNLETMTTLEQYTNLHAKLIENLHKGDQVYCESAIDHLKGQFNGEVDSFYDHVMERFNKND
jgi:hypothetical protein